MVHVIVITPIYHKILFLYNHTPTQGYVAKITKPHVTLVHILKFKTKNFVQFNFQQAFF
jgi:hypothetical protein